MAVDRNITIDDQGGDERTGQIPVYFPPIAWATQTCSGCAIKPDVNRVFNKTYTAATFMPDQNIPLNSMDFTFNGTAVYIFFTLFNFEGENVTVNTECNFTIDEENAGYLNHTGDRSRPFQRDYQVPVFSKTGLEQSPHHANISVSGIDYHVFLSFDYAIYTTTDTDTVPTSGSKTPPGAVAGGIIGGLLVLLCLTTLVWLYRRSHRLRQTVLPSPFQTHSTSENASPKGLSTPPPPTSTAQPETERTLRSLPVAQTSHSSQSQSTVTPEHPPGTKSLPRKRPTALVPPPNISHEDGACSRSAVNLADEVRQLREEVTSLRRQASQGNLIPINNEPPPTYDASIQPTTGDSRHNLTSTVDLHS